MLSNICHIIFTVIWLTVKTFKKWLRDREAVLLELNSIQQASISNHLLNLVHILENSFQSVKSLMIEINS